MNFNPKDTCVWNLPMSEPNNARSLALTSKVLSYQSWHIMVHLCLIIPVHRRRCIKQGC